MNLYKKCTAKTYSFLVNDTTLASYNSLRYRHSLSQIMAIDKIRDEKLQCDITREAALSASSSSGKIDKYEYLIGKETLPSNQNQMMKQDIFI